jgi:DNA-binding transcriptional MocR family regulator
VEEEIVITNGSQQGIDLVARTFLEPGDRVLVENPTYTGAIQVFQSHAARLVGVPVDGEGMIPGRLEEALARGPAKLLYLIPNFQNPTSGTMSLARRRTIIAMAQRHGVPILEDDFGGALRFEGEAVPAMKSLESGNGVIYMSTFAKKLLPGIRIGWLTAPREVAERLAQIKQIADWNTSLLLQGALYEFCRRGDLDRHLKRVLEIYRQRRDVMLEAIEKHFPRQVSFTRPRGGLVVWVTLPRGVDADEVTAEAQGRGVLVGRGDLFFVDGLTHDNLRLVFAQASPDEIRRGVKILGAILRKQLRRRESGASGAHEEPLPIH